jgi:peptidoglycan hydrolase CwlO-like protein
MFKSLILICAFSVICLAQPQQQPTPQQTVTALVSQQANLTAQIITILNQLPELVKQNQDLQAQVKDLQEKLNKKEVKK